MAANQTFVDFLTPVPADWLNNVNNFVNYTQTFNVASLRTTKKGSAQIIQTECYSTIGDFGQGTYYYNPFLANYTLTTPTLTLGQSTQSQGILVPGQTYSYRIAAIDESGVTLASTSQLITLTGTNNAVDLSWALVPGAAGYIIYGRTFGAEFSISQVNYGFSSTRDYGWVAGGDLPPVSQPWQFDNGGSRIQAADGGRYCLMNQDSNYYVEQFGAKVNNASFDNQGVIQTAINAAWCNGGGIVHFRAGVYMSNTLFMQTNVSLKGIGTDHSGWVADPAVSDSLGTTLRCIAGVNSAIGFIYNPLYVHSYRLMNLNIDGNSAGNPLTSYAIYINPGNPVVIAITNEGEDLYLSIEDCGITGGTTAGLFTGPAGRGGRIYNSYIYNCPGFGLNIATSDWTVSHCLFGQNGVNLQLLGCEATHIDNCDIFSPVENGPNTGINVIIADNPFFLPIGGGLVRPNGIWFTGCEFDFAPTTSVTISGSGTRNIVFQGCRWNASSIAHNNTYSDLFISNTVLNGGVVLMGCSFISSFVTNFPTYNIQFQTPGTPWISACNNFYDVGSSIGGISNSPSSVRLTASSNPSAFLDSTGNLFALQGLFQNPTTSENQLILTLNNATQNVAIFNTTNAQGWNASGSALFIGRNTGSNRSINAGGTVNASGADYAEYMLKRPDCGDIAKGALVGIDQNGLLTDKYADAFSFLVKSTNPSYVGNDTWGEGLEAEELELARLKVDRVAFSGQVPVNVTQGKPGDYIIPVDANGTISGYAVSDPTFEQYQKAVGRIKNFGEDGRAIIFVKVG